MKIETLRHSFSHILAAAIQQLYPEAKFGIGPVIENGFYYDLELPHSLTPQDLPKIEKRMKRIISQNLPFEKEEMTAEAALKLFKKLNQPYKVELIKDLVKEEKASKVTVYKTGDFIDLCRGPHVRSTKEAKPEAFKLTHISGAYWRGDENQPMLQRIYGTAFENKAELDKYLSQQEEAAKRDHRRLGKELDLFSIDNYVGPGLVLWHPKLSTTREEIELYWRKEHRRRGYEYVYTPHIGLSQLWETSGHLDFFKDGMYPPMDMGTKDKKEKAHYYVKPMNCPFHVRIYKSRPRSYRELPLRWCELGTVYRYEESGTLHGMLRVRGLTQDDAHIICREDQFAKEIEEVVDFALSINKAFGFKDLKAYLSVRDPKDKDKYIGQEKIWNLAEKTLTESLKKKKLDFQKDVGGAKFYGPSIDLKAVDCMGREWQGTTIQLDMNLPSKFNMTYVGQDGKEHTPIMLHRTLLGTMERFIGTLLEHYAGALPTWISPVQVSLIPVSQKFNKYAEKIAKVLREQDIRIEVKDEDMTLGKKIRESETHKNPYMLILGAQEKEKDIVSVRARSKGDIGQMKLDQFVEKIKKEIEDKK